MRVLVVDDAPDILEVFKICWGHLDVELEVASSVAEALAAARRRLPDVVITDYMMPGATGLDLLRELRGFSADVPAILLTAYVGPEFKQLAREAGVFAYVRKPFDPDELFRLAELAARG